MNTICHHSKKESGTYYTSQNLKDSGSLGIQALVRNGDVVDRWYMFLKTDRGLPKDLTVSKFLMAMPWTAQDKGDV
jgi:hypothetical protein